MLYCIRKSNSNSNFCSVCFIAQLICDQFFSSPFLLHGLFCVGHCDNLFSLGPFCWEIISPSYLCFILLSVLVLHFDCVIKQNNQTNQMQITTIYNYQETCISCTLQCQELGATGTQLPWSYVAPVITMYQCIFNIDQYPKYNLSYLVIIFIFLIWRHCQQCQNC